MSEETHEGTSCLRHCFCEVSLEELRHWATKRYRENIPTVDLMSSTRDLHEREVIGLVGMLDADDAIVLQLMGDVNQPTHHIIHCRQNIRALLADIWEDATADDALTKVAVIDDEMQAQVLATILEENKIPHVIHSYHDSALDGLFQGSHGWGHVEAPLAHHDDIRRLLSELTKG